MSRSKSVAFGLAAPPWLQRDWDPVMFVCLSVLCLQHLPDFKGIETALAVSLVSPTSCSTSLTSKGLRLPTSISNHIKDLAAPPWLQRDWDHANTPTRSSLPPCSTSLTSKGLRHTKMFIMTHEQTCSTSLTSKGLRQLEMLFDILVILAAPPWLQRDWD